MQLSLCRNKGRQLQGGGGDCVQGAPLVCLMGRLMADLAARQINKLRHTMESKCRRLVRSLAIAESSASPTTASCYTWLRRLMERVRGDGL